MSAIRLLVADVDGTIVTSSKELTDATIAVAQELREAGVALALTSGRPPRGMAALIEPLGLTTPLAAFNGALITTPDLAVISQLAIAELLVPRGVDVLTHAGLDVWLYQGGDWFVRNLESPHVVREARTVAFEPVVVDDFTHLTRNVVKLVGVSDDRAIMERARGAVHRHFADQLAAAASQPYYLDVTNRRANKGSVVDFFCVHFGLRRDQIAVIGDMATDVAMFERAGLAIAMGNANAAVQHAADKVTLSNDREGFAFAVRTYVLSERATS
ncbi:MAG TPA: Cof-type HAD-IIB family hydrolase [Acidimicrobiales bacterium]|nr:Cof-type HAD-IIB family hydrolase [Acidimicrobiales bacterium]